MSAVPRGRVQNTFKYIETKKRLSGSKCVLSFNSFHFQLFLSWTEAETKMTSRHKVVIIQIELILSEYLLSAQVFFKTANGVVIS